MPRFLLSTCNLPSIYSHFPSFPPSADAEARLAAAQAAVAAGQAKANLLLEMMGERDEEVEDLRGELEEVRETYRFQLEGLMQRAAAAGETPTVATAVAGAPAANAASPQGAIPAPGGPAR